LLFLSFGLGSALKPLPRNRIFKVVFIPGLIAAALLRLVACYITGAEAKKGSLFSRDSAGLSYDLQDATLLGKVIMGTLPFLAMLIFSGIILLDQSRWEPSPLKPEELPAASSFLEKLAQLGQIVNYCADVILSAPRWLWTAVTAGNWHRLIGLYLIIALLAWLPPQRKESRYAVAGVAFVGLLVWFPFYAANKLKTGLGALQEQKISLSLSRLIGVLVCALVISIVCVRIPASIYKLSRRGKRKVSTE
jgi:hypothetical protein